MVAMHKRADSLGLALKVNTIGAREFGRLIKTAGVRRIKFHGLRHNSRYVDVVRPRPGASRPASARSLENRDDARDLRARLAVDAAGRGVETGSPDSPLNRGAGICEA